MSSMEVTEGMAMKFAHWLTDASLSGIGPLSSSTALAQEYLLDQSYADMDDRVSSMINWEASKNFATGFLTGLGGFFTLPITLPSGMAAAWAVQARMVGAIAEMYGHSVKSEKVRTAILLCLIGSDMTAVLRQCGVNVGNKVAKNLISKIPGEVIKKINQIVGFKLLTKAGEKGVINLLKAVPLLAAIPSGIIDAAACRTVGRVAQKCFSK